MSTRGTADDWRPQVAPITRTSGDARRTYDRLAPWYDVVEAPFERRARAAGVRLLQARPGEAILEIGPGTGHTLAALAPQVSPGGLLVGVDLSRRMLGVTRRRLAHAAVHPRTILAQGDARSLPIDDVAVDAVTMNFVLELMATEDIRPVLAECRRVLRPGGRLVVVSLDLRRPKGPATRLYLAAHRRWPRLVDCRPIPLADVLTSAGFEIRDRWSSAIAGLPVAAVAAG